MVPVIRQIPVEKLHRGKHQPREDFDSDALQELADSIRTAGLIQPIVVRRSDNDFFEIIAGERRWRAAQLAQLENITCLVSDFTDKQAAAVTNIENLQRKDLNPIEQAQGLQLLLDEFDYLHEEVAAIVCKSRAWVTNALRLLKLETQVRELVRSGQLSGGHAKILVGLTREKQIEFADLCIKHHWSVRKLESSLNSNTHSPGKTDQGKNDPDTERFERSVSDQFGAPVKLDYAENEKGGWLKIRYFDHDTLAGLLDKMGIDYD